jgi:hypothetical protein
LEGRPHEEPEDNADALRVAGERLAEAYLPEKELLGIDWVSISKKVLMAVLGIFAFVLGVQLMKASAQGLAPSLESIFTTLFISPTSALGFGWSVT